jgi:hypothetical protein
MVIDLHGLSELGVVAVSVNYWLHLLRYHNHLSKIDQRLIRLHRFSFDKR